jgi:hypothetical protein
MNNMMLVSSTWGTARTFKMMPILSDCPYIECIFDVESKVLAVISRLSKESLHMLPKLDDKGDVVRFKIGKKENGKDYAEERKLLSTFYEYYITEKEEIETFVNMFAYNTKTFDFMQYLNSEVAAETSKIVTAL